MSEASAWRDALAKGAILRRLPEVATLVVTGADRQSWLNGLVTCDLKSLGPREARYGLVVGKTGRVQADVWIAVTPERLLVAVPRAAAAGVQALFDHHLIMEDVELSLDATGLGWVIALGPAAPTVVTEAIAGDAAAVARGRYGAVEAVLLVATDAVLARLCAAACARPDVRELDEPGWEALRVEQVWPRRGVDFGEVYPQEAALEALAVSFQKGCYLGQEAVFMLEKRGQAAKRLVQLRIEGTDAVALGTEVVHDGHAVGAVTSAVSGDGAVLALATLRRTAAATGTALGVAGRAAVVSRGL